MCMITAVWGSNKSDILGKKFLTWLIRENSVTNKNGTGIGNRKTIWKSPLDGIQATKKKDYWDVLYNMEYPILGHVRIASTGRNARDGLHPFLCGNTSVIHNGTFQNYKDFLKESGLDDPDPVDSHVFSAVLDKRRKDKPLTPELITRTLQDLGNSFAVGITDHLNGNVWIVRGTSSLYYTVIGDHHIINTSFSSLDGLAEIAEMFLEMGVGPIEEVPKWKVFRLTNTGLEQAGEMKPIEQVKIHTEGRHTGIYHDLLKVKIAVGIRKVMLFGDCNSITAFNAIKELLGTNINVQNVEQFADVLEELMTVEYSKETSVINSDISNDISRLEPEIYELIDFPWYTNSPEQISEAIANLKKGGRTN